MDLWKCVFLLFIFSVVSINDVKCVKNINFHLASQTPYRFVENPDEDVGKYPGCEPIKLWMMSRHGTRYPNKQIITDMLNKLPTLRDLIVDNYDKENGRLNVKQIEAFKNWKPAKLDVAKEKTLAAEGAVEMNHLAKRMKMRFQNILLDSYDEKMFRFKHTPTERAYSSAKNFAAGLFGEATAKNVLYNMTSADDPVLRFYKQCQCWEQTVKKNDKTYVELNLYLSGTELTQALNNITHLLGFESGIAYETAKLFYKTCGFETAWNGSHTSPWCSAFDENSILTTEYMEDLKHYWADGYAYSISGKIACNVLKDMIDFFNEQNGPSSALYFTHAGTMLKTYNFFGFYNSPDSLNHTHRDPDRPWRLSRISAFGSNLGAVLYNCENSLQKVLFLHQERPIRLPECPDEDLCPLERILEARSAVLKECDLKKICNCTKDEL